MERFEASSVGLYLGQVLSLVERKHTVLENVPRGGLVSVEGTPINLDRFWAREHAFGYNDLLSIVCEELHQRGCSIEHVVLLDDYTVEPTVSADEYLSRIAPRVDRVEMESSFAPRAQEIVDQVGRSLIRPDGRPIDLVTRDGRFVCPLLDAAFQETKRADFNILIHPIEYKHEQDEMRTILLAAKGSLPFTLINIFFKGVELNKAFVTEPDGGTKRVL